MSKTSNNTPAVRERTVRMVLDHEKDYFSRWSAVSSISGKIGCTARTLNEWVTRAEVNRGERAGIPMTQPRR